MDKNSSAYKAVLLSVVCAVAGLLLSSVNKITKPIIDANSLKAVQGTLEEFFPDGEFEDVTSKYKTDEYDKVEGIYEAKGEGYVFTLTGQGYSSDGFKFAIAFDNDGKIVGYKGLESNETQGKGSKAFDDDYADQVKQLTSTDAMPLISGATITTTAVGESVTQAEEIFNNIQGISFDADAAKPAAPEAAKAEVLGQADFSSRKASCEDKGDGVYACKAAGFASDLQATITVKDGKVDSITDVSGSENGDGVGDVLFYGRGAGKLPTASAVVGDIIDCLKHQHTVLSLTWEDSESADFIEHYKQVETAMYVRINAQNAESLKASVSEMFGKVMYIERAGRPDNELAFITPVMKEADIDVNLNNLSRSAEIASKIRLL